MPALRHGAHIGGDPWPVNDRQSVAGNVSHFFLQCTALCLAKFRAGSAAHYLSFMTDIHNKYDRSHLQFLVRHADVSVGSGKAVLVLEALSLCGICYAQIRIPRFKPPLFTSHRLHSMKRCILEQMFFHRPDFL